MAISDLLQLLVPHHSINPESSVKSIPLRVKPKPGPPSKPEAGPGFFFSDSVDIDADPATPQIISGTQRLKSD